MVEVNKQFRFVERSNFTHILVRSQLDPDDDQSLSISVDRPGIRIQPAIEIVERDLLAETGQELTNEIYASIVKHFAQEYKERVKENIESQAFKSRWDDLTDKYKQFKSKANLDDRIWIRTGQLLDAIRVRFFPQGFWTIGIDANEMFREVETIKNDQGEIVDHRLGGRTDVSILQVSRYMEFGTENMPARPLWRPTTANIMDDARDIYEDWKRSEGSEFGL